MLTRWAGGRDIWLKREDLNGCASSNRHHIVGLILLARRMNKSEIITACGSTNHGIECATLCATLGMACSIYVGARDALNQVENIQKIMTMGSTVIRVNNGGMSLREATGEALRASTDRFRTSFYRSISATRPDPYPSIVRTFQSIIGRQAMRQLNETCGRLPSLVTAPISDNGTAAGFFYPFLECQSVRLLGVEAFGSAALCRGSQGVYGGAFTYVMQDDDGQILPTESLSADMNLPAVGPELAYWAQIGRLECVSASNEEATEGLRIMQDTEAIVSSLESAYAIQKVLSAAQRLDRCEVILLLISGP
ncbi:hypothetical protein N7539_008400 [Penicillium diatomitis]|uniref:tryptophan synthase n=1 Tax=Penicillium diatomitis TaxID=2819901 RepID=A0A9X0BNA3_9EURO|nr:uncharacterized protein N7539_008400 [Penicillium diatomitis]KAJ5475334.1 hypothetical protein N7539_008400 [Penicillium diatomitis]